MSEQSRTQTCELQAEGSVWQQGGSGGELNTPESELDDSDTNIVSESKSWDGSLPSPTQRNVSGLVKRSLQLIKYWLLLN